MTPLFKVDDRSSLRIAMADSAFELINQTTVRIGDRVLTSHLCDPPLEGKHRYVIEATSDERNRYGQQLYIHDFREIYPTDLPNGISINIERPKSSFRDVGFIDIKKSDDHSELSIIVCLDFADWHLPLNLPHFAEKYIDSLKENVAGILRAEIETTDAGLYIVCGVTVMPTSTYLSAYRNLDAQVLATYRKCLGDIYKPKSVKKAEPGQPQDYSGTKWWVRYVVVPVIGSGAFAAAAAWLIAHAM